MKLYVLLFGSPDLQREDSRWTVAPAPPDRRVTAALAAFHQRCAQESATYHLLCAEADQARAAERLEQRNTPQPEGTSDAD